jgi:hypothetical protein
MSGPRLLRLTVVSVGQEHETSKENCESAFPQTDKFVLDNGDRLF